MISWFHKLFNPHCEHCAEEARELREEKREAARCNSCDVLKMEVARLQIENKMLLDKLLKEPTIEPKIDTTELKPITPKHARLWSVQRQMLQSEDRATAKALAKNNSNNAEKISTEDLEKELDVVANARENSNT